MTYQALARKWRPRNFSEVVGQEHTVAALTNALDSDRIHHALLFTGTRGVGKTTLARIFAKALNCENGVSSKPCGQCAACVAIDEGRYVDLIEVDAASRTKVDDTRELLDNVQYAPTIGRYKVYLIDEVHMLSGHSFNALLKTLEEPPPHVKFLLATTDLKKLPVTVLSRCLQFYLKVLSPEQIAGQLEAILQSEEIQFEAPAIELLARSADGSMRDGLSLLDQAISHGGGQVAETAVRAMLGTIGEAHTAGLLAALADQDPQALLAVVAEMAAQAADYEAGLDELLLALYHISLQQMAPEALAAKQRSQPWHAELAERWSPEDVQLYYQIGLIGKRDLPLAPDPRTGFEMVLLRMLAFRPADAHTQAPPQTPDATRKPARLGPAASESAGRKTASTVPATARAAPRSISADNWPTVITKLGAAGFLKELAMNISPVDTDSDPMQFQLDVSHEGLLTEEREQVLAEAISGYLGTKVRLRIEVGSVDTETPAQQNQRVSSERQQAARDSITNDPHVQEIVDLFDATVVDESIRARK
ncbi:MAG: DNA polymerase III subunit gamma/tau [Gammaproteobacteria bacterium]|nr:DNA polymerase III subunit gamma/tau [Gammaproteobacteria bacterium]